MSTARTQGLSVETPNTPSPVSSAITSPTEPRSRSVSPKSPVPRHAASDRNRVDRDFYSNATSDSQHQTDPPGSSSLTSLPPFPSSPKSTPKHLRDQSKSFFLNLKASKSSNKVHTVEPTIRQVSDVTTQSNKEHQEHGMYSLRKNTGSTPDLSKSTFDNVSIDTSDGSHSQTDTSSKRPAGTSIMSDTALMTSRTDLDGGRRGKPRFAQLLTRTRSMRVDENGRRSKPPTPIRTTGPEEMSQHSQTSYESGGLKTAPLNREKDRSIRDMMGSAMRNRSADRPPPSKQSQPIAIVGRVDQAPSQGPAGSLATSQAGSAASHRENTGTHLFNNIKSGSTRAADGIGKVGKGFFGKMARTGSSSTNHHVDDEPYVCTTINLPLVEQTRRTRIAKRLEDSKDKTEFWMPALPWRCIDYLNFRGCEEEGLYRIPGSGPKVREWQRRFDQEYDINLFNEPDLYDINIIGSMFKAWCRDLPSEILPKDIQAKVARECAGAKEVPQTLKDALSNLPPWNYYLLFAITCHLSLLHAYVEKNKMNYNNLCICFQPCLKIDSFCFQFLVCDWRNCWQGCWTEKAALEEEYRVLDRLHSSGADSSGGSTAPTEERSLASAQSNKPRIIPRAQDRGKPPPLSLTKPSDERLPTPTTKESGHSRNGSRLPELAPVMPLSPIGIYEQ